MKRPYVFKKETLLDEHYNAEAFAIRCFDDRFRKVFDKFIRSLGIERIDVESCAGGAKVLASPEAKGDSDFALREIEKSIRLHKTKKVWLFTHSDCGAYGGLAQFNGDKEKELAFHIEQHKKARERVKTRFPDIEVSAYFIDKQGVVKTM